MSDTEKISDWCRWYEASDATYKAWALQAVWRNEKKLFHAVVTKLNLTLEKLCEDMSK